MARKQESSGRLCGAVCCSTAWCGSSACDSSAASLEMARSYLYEYAVWTLPFAFFILVIASGPTFLSPFLGSRWLVLLGEASYALYIFHWIVIRGFRIWEVTGHGISALAGWSLLGATIPVSVLLFKYVETPARVFLRGNSESRISDAPMTERNGTTSTGAAVAA